MPRRAFPLLLLLAVTTQAVWCQEAPPIKLVPKDTFQVGDAPPGGFMIRVPVKCDGHADVYLRYYSGTEVDAMPVVKVTRDGKLETRFAIRSIPGFQKGVAYDFALGIRGEIYFLAARRLGEREIVRFERDGNSASSFKLDPSIDPQNIAVFPSGELLVSGEELSTKTHKPTGRPLLALYDPGGKFLREISLPRDEVSAAQNDESGEDVSLRATAEPAEDGNVYLMRLADTLPVYVISPAGTVLRRLEIPSPGKEFHSNQMRIAGGNLVVEFYRDNPSGPGSLYLYSVFSAYSGEKIADYTPAKEAIGIWACYSPDAWTFLSSRGNPPRMTLIRANP